MNQKEITTRYTVQYKLTPYRWFLLVNSPRIGVFGEFTPYWYYIQFRFKLH